MSAFTPDQIALQQHIRNENERFAAACKAKGHECFAAIVDDPAHWARVGVLTVAQYESAMLRSDFSDRYKEENGFRPDLSRWTEAQMFAWLGRERLVGKICALVNHETGALTRGMDFVRSALLSPASNSDLSDVLAWCRLPGISPWVARFVGGEAASILRERGALVG